MQRAIVFQDDPAKQRIVRYGRNPCNCCPIGIIEQLPREEQDFRLFLAHVCATQVDVVTAFLDDEVPWGYGLGRNAGQEVSDALADHGHLVMFFP